VPTVDQIFPRKYLSAEADLFDPATKRWKEYTLTIDRLDLEEVGQDGEIVPVLYFAGARKGLRMNKTMIVATAEIAGSRNTEDWKGSRVTIFHDKAQYGPKSFDVIRVKPATADAEQTKLTQATETRTQSLVDRSTLDELVDTGTIRRGVGEAASGSSTEPPF
jgi:hypothetical protein